MRIPLWRLASSPAVPLKHHNDYRDKEASLLVSSSMQASEERASEATSVASTL